MLWRHCVVTWEAHRCAKHLSMVFMFGKYVESCVTAIIVLMKAHEGHFRWALISHSDECVNVGERCNVGMKIWLNGNSRYFFADYFTGKFYSIIYWFGRRALLNVTTILLLQIKYSKGCAIWRCCFEIHALQSGYVLFSNTCIQSNAIQLFC